MKAINKILRAIHLPTDNKGATQDSDTSPDKTLIDVTEMAQNRYGYQVPVLISQLAYRRCVTVASGQDNHNERLWLFKVLALAKYAIGHSGPGAVLAGLRMSLKLAQKYGAE